MISYPPCPTCGADVKEERRTFGTVLRCNRCGAVRTLESVPRWGSPKPEQPQRFGESLALDELNFIRQTGFCRRCYAATTDESPGSTFTINVLFGFRFLGWSGECPRCESVERTLWFLFVIPLLPLGKYRIKYVTEGLLNSRYIGRALKR